MVLRRNGEPVAILSLEKIRQTGTLEQSGFKIEWRAGQASALDTGKIPDGRDVGNLIVREIVGDREVDAVHDITFAFVANAFHPKIPILQ